MIRSAVRVAAVAVAAAAILSLSPVSASIAHAKGAPGDPLEGYNRAIFKFNDKVDVWIFEPVAKGWNFIVPPAAQEHLADFFENLRFPVIFLNCVLQAKPTRAGIALGRFTMNTLFGLGGLLDVAATTGLKPVDEDFGQTLGRWGVGGGPYLVWPFVGPSNPRDTIGMVADSATRVWPYFVDIVVVYTTNGVNLVNTRALYLDTIRDAKRDSLDYYAAVRDAYLQRRQALIEDRSRDEGHDKLYFPDGQNDQTEQKAGKSEDDLYYPDVE
jgi:phospholipid-binding lipoprotein MlaA